MALLFQLLAYFRARHSAVGQVCVLLLGLMVLQEIAFQGIEGRHKLAPKGMHQAGSKARKAMLDWS